MIDPNQITENRAAFQAAMIELYSVERDLTLIANSFAITGQPNASEKFSEIAASMRHSLQQANKLFHDAHDLLFEEIQEAAKISERNTLEIVKGILEAQKQRK